MKPRKLEYFEDRLKVSPEGREVLDVIRTHAREVLYLVQKNRATMVCWQRHHGPAFVKAIVDSGFEKEAEFKNEINGISLEMLVLNIAEALQDNGSPALKAAIGKHVLAVLTIIKEANSLDQIIYSINYTIVKA